MEINSDNKTRLNDEIVSALIESRDTLAVLRKRVFELEQKNTLLEKRLSEKHNELSYVKAENSCIKENMALSNVKHWKDSDGVDFSGSVYWIKNEGTACYEDGTYFQGEWDIDGVINNGLLYNDKGEAIQELKDRELVE